MELSYDWRTFQTMFYPRRRPNIAQGSVPAGAINVVIDQDTVVVAFGEYEDLSEWIGASFKEMSAQMTNRQLIAFQRSDVDSWISEAAGLPHFFDQVELLRTKAAGTAGSGLKFPRHFLIEALCGWWNRLLPSCYGLFVRVEGQPDQDIILLVRRGAFDGFHRPDLVPLGPERGKQASEIVKYLSERYLAPVQGVFVSAADWAEWSRDPNPWRNIAKAVSANRARLVPFRWGIAFLMSLRAFFGI